jgi:hypothetical protein
MKRLLALVASVALASAAVAADPAGPRVAPGKERLTKGGAVPVGPDSMVPAPQTPSPPVAAVRNQIAFRGDFTLTQPTKVFYGDDDGPYNEKDLAPGKYHCGDDFFGDPEPRATKGCKVVEAGNNSTKVADEGGDFTLTEASWVAFGSKGHYNKSLVPAGTFACGTAIFGNVGAAPRTCIVIRNGKPKTLNAAGPQDALILTNGAVDPAKYAAVAATFGTDAGMDYRFGPSPAHYGTTGNAGFSDYAARPILGKIGDVGPNATGKLPNCTGTRGEGSENGCTRYSFGPLKKETLDYSSSGVQVPYLPDAEPDDRFFRKPYFGLANYLGLSVDYGVFSVLPQISWTMTEGFTQNGGDNDYNMDRYTGAKPGRPAWVPAVTPDYRPIASTVCMGRGGWCTNTLTVWKNGDITASGGNTNHNYLTYNLGDASKVPTGIAITNSGEFALVTVWDTANTKGQIAVLALAEGCQGCNPNDEAGWSRNWGNWRKVYHGLPGLGNYIGMKLLGYVDLPSNVKAPTGIAASTGVPATDYYHSGEWGEPLEVEYNRRSYFAPVDPTPKSVTHSKYRSVAIARAGMATVWSKSEKTVAFVDLQPLFAYYRQQYFGQSQSGFDAMIANRGTGASQWPYTFDHTPSQKPVVVKTVKLASAPTAGQMQNAKFDANGVRSVVATQDGKLHVFTLGSAYVNNATSTTGVPAEIGELFSIDVGRNVTQLVVPSEHGWHEKYDTKAYPGDDPNAAPRTDRYMIAVSRGDRKIQWIRFNAKWTSATVHRTLQDRKLLDPIGIFDLPNHGTESYVLSIADYGGRALHNFLYGRVIMHTHTGKGVGCAEDNGSNPPRGGCGLLGGLPFEYGGAKAIPGRPFQPSGQNIN